MKYELDIHGQMIMEEYHEAYPVFEKMRDIVTEKLSQLIEESGIYVTAIETRVKKEGSLAGKLELKGRKYATLENITDILGARIVAFYTDDVDKIAALVERMFVVDWEHSVDKRRILDLDKFGYLSLHYICRIPRTLYHDEQTPDINRYPFEIQMRTALQHVWATMYHDTGYKSAAGIGVPKEHLRNMNRLAGLLELADEQFSRIRKEITDYRRHVQALVANGNFDEVELNGDSFSNYIELQPFKNLIDRIASINQAEVYQDSYRPYLKVLQNMKFKTLGDLERMRQNSEERAYQLALHQLAGTDLDIVAGTLALQNLCIVHIVQSGGGTLALKQFYDDLNGKNSYNESRAQHSYEQATLIIR